MYQDTLLLLPPYPKLSPPLQICPTLSLGNKFYSHFLFCKLLAVLRAHSSSFPSFICKIARTHLLPSSVDLLQLPPGQGDFLTLPYVPAAFCTHPYSTYCHYGYQLFYVLSPLQTIGACGQTLCLTHLRGPST